MKTHCILTVIALSSLHLQLSTSVRAQGSLIPPGAPAPTMKTLDQVEARTPVDTAHTPGDADSLFVITQPGSYYLTGNTSGVTAKHGIKITAAYVTLDLNGFTVTGTAGSLTGIHVPGATPGLSISNGVVTGWGQNGVGAASAADSMYDRLRVSDNGVAGAGFSGLTCQSGCLVTDCRFDDNSGNGLTVQTGCTIINVTAQDNTHYGISAGTNCLVRDSQCVLNTAIGIFAGAGCVITGCSSSGSTGSGIVCGEGSLVSSCNVHNNDLYGIFTGNAARVTACVAEENGTTSNHVGILTGSRCSVSGCTASINTGYGVRTGDMSRVTGCTARLNGNGVAGTGIVTGIRCTVAECTTSENGANGILVAGDCVVRRCRSSNNGGISQAHGIRTTGSGSLISENLTSGNTGYGIRSDAGVGADVVIRNTAASNTAGNYSPASGTQFGPLQAPNTATSPSANF